MGKSNGLTEEGETCTRVRDWVGVIAPSSRYAIIPAKDILEAAEQLKRPGAAPNFAFTNFYVSPDPKDLSESDKDDVVREAANQEFTASPHTSVNLPGPALSRREEVWLRVWVSLAPIKAYKDEPGPWADVCLKEFDERFGGKP